MTTTQALDEASRTAKNINTISVYLANPEFAPKAATTSDTAKGVKYEPVSSSTDFQPKTLIFAPSAILHQADTIFSLLRSSCNSESTTRSDLSNLTTLILTGGIGHSTAHLYNAVSRHPIYNTLPSLISRPTLEGLAEARIFYLVFIHYHDGEIVMNSWNAGKGLKVLVEERSTNCGANASLSRQMLEQDGIVLGQRDHADDVLIVQDPTMSLRTKASFMKVFENEVQSDRVRFWCWPIFVPKVTVVDGVGITWDGEALAMAESEHDRLWDMKRFNGLILGEIERLRDDVNGYGPKGRGFIVHVDMPVSVLEAYKRIMTKVEVQR